jgi:hypothetical protein
MREPVFFLTLVPAVLCTVVLLFDYVPRMWVALRRRRASHGGAWGVVLDSGGAVLGAYLDPFGHPWRTPRIHGAGSPWVQRAAPGEKAWAWEGFGANEEEARLSANRLRRRHLQLLGLLEDDETDEEGGSFVLPTPFAPPSA